MPSSTSDFTVAVNDVLYVDRWGISTLTTFNTNLNIQVWNQSPQPIYVKAVINDPNGNWKFDGDTTAKQLGEARGFDYANFKATLKRAVPSSDVEDEQFTITFEFYKDSSYSQKVDQISKTIKANIIDFHASPANWTVSIDDFDDGTAQGWSGDFSVSNVASVKSNGYSMYYYLSGTTATKLPYISKSISVPSGVSKATLIFYYGAHLFSGWNGKYARLNYVRVYMNDTKIYEDHIDAKVDYDPTHKYVGWNQIGIDLTPYAGQDITIKIEFEEKLDYTSVMYIKTAVDEIIIAMKS